ncbi:MAG TPA: hypothetical protein VMP03_03695 [Methylomirabilota bacterium]|nr:hypothetical protein [Methylomirabilota bacterium]
MTSFLGPFATSPIMSVVGFSVELISGRSVNPSELVIFLFLSFVIGIYGFIFVLPGAALLSTGLNALRVTARISYIAAGAILSLTYIILSLTYIVGVPALLRMSAEEGDLAFLATAALSGALCGEVYWRMAVKSRPSEPERTVEPPMA